MTDVVTDAPAPCAPVLHRGRPSRFAWWLAAITLLALAGRVAYAVWYHDAHPAIGTAGDPYYYHEQANLLVRGHLFVSPFQWRENHVLVPSAYHPPLYTLYLALWSALGATSRLWHILASALLGGTTVGVVGLFGRQVGGERIGLAAATVAALYPALWLNDALLMSESLFGLTIAATLWLSYRYRARPSLTGAALLAVAVGLAALTRAEAVLLYPFLALPLVLGSRPATWATRGRHLGAVALAAVVLIAPWTIYNTVRFGRLVPMTTSTGDLLAFANCRATYQGPMLGSWSYPCAGSIPRSGDETVDDRRGREKGLRYARRHVGRLPTVVAARVGRTFEVFRPGQAIVYNASIENRGVLPSRLAQWSFWILGAFSVAGLVELRRRGLTLIPPLAVTALVAVTSATAYGFVRLRLPVDVAVCVLAPLGAVGLARIARRSVPHGGSP